MERWESAVDDHYSSIPLFQSCSLANSDCFVVKFDGLADFDFTAFAGFDISVDGDEAFVDHDFCFAPGAAQMCRFEELEQRNMFAGQFKFNHEFSFRSLFTNSQSLSAARRR